MTLLAEQGGLFLFAGKSLVVAGLVVAVFAAQRWQPARWRANYLLAGLLSVLALPCLTMLLPPLAWLDLGNAPQALDQQRGAFLSSGLAGVARASNTRDSGAELPYEGRDLKFGPPDAARADSAEIGLSLRERLRAKAVTAVRSLPWTPVLTSLWLFGSLLLLLRFLASLIALESLRRRSLPIAGDDFLDVPDGVEVLAADVSSPLTFGLLRPVVVLPADKWLEWTPEQLEVVLRHETEHIARRDWASRVLVETAVAVHWFNPLVWHLRNRLRLEQEISCDQAVIEGGWLSARRYGEHLLDLAEHLRMRDPNGLAVGMATKSNLEQRIMSMTRTTSSSRNSISILSLLLLAVAAPTVAALQQEPASSELREVLHELEAREARMAPFHREMEERQEAMAPFLKELEEKAHQMEAQMQQVQTVELRELERQMADRARRMEELHEPFLAVSQELQQKLEAVQEVSGAEVEKLAREIERTSRELAEKRVPDEEVQRSLKARAQELQVLQEEMKRRMEPALEQLRQFEQQQTDSMRGELEIIEREMKELAAKHEQLVGDMPGNLEPIQAEMALIQSRMADQQRALEAAHQKFEDAHEQDLEIFERLKVAQQLEIGVQLRQVLGTELSSASLERVTEALNWRISEDHVRVRGSAAELKEILGQDPGLSLEQVERAVEHLLELELQY